LDTTSTSGNSGSEVEELIARCRMGESDAFREIVERYRGYAFSLAFRILWDEDDARETVQESFVRVWKHLSVYENRSKFTTWLYSIVSHLAQDRLKANRRRERIFSRLSATNDNARDTQGADPSTRLENKELAERIKALAGDLPPVQRMVFALRDLQDLSISEIADHLRMSAGAVKANLCLARARIRRSMEQLERSGGTYR
jgi:RNA polymerase sigma-70 factor, ECF subfamily